MMIMLINDDDDVDNDGNPGDRLLAHVVSSWKYICIHVHYNNKLFKLEIQFSVRISIFFFF